MTPYASRAGAYDAEVAEFEQLCANEAWKFFTLLCKSAFNADVLQLLRNFAASNPHVPIREHIHLLQQLVGDHVRLALSEADVSLGPDRPTEPPRRLAFKKRSLSLRPPTCVTPIPEDSELSSRPARAATAGTPAELYGSTDPAARHTICSPTTSPRDWSRSCRELDTARRHLVALPLADTTAVEIPASRDNTSPPESFVRAKSSWRGRPRRRSMRTVSLNLAPITALLDKRDRRRSARSKVAAAGGTAV